MAVLKRPPRFGRCPVCGYGRAKVRFKTIVNSKNSTITVRYIECPKCGYKSKPEL
ncbi:MAG: hypothetical protein J7K83_04155 [Candidatus Aenigmarchaeota archaeon]|nr:hypothetical protein [Candidatus Aenigmarchaeota archaeon]